MPFATEASPPKTSLLPLGGEWRDCRCRWYERDLASGEAEQPGGDGASDVAEDLATLTSRSRNRSTPATRPANCSSTGRCRHSLDGSVGLRLQTLIEVTYAHPSAAGLSSGTDQHGVLTLSAGQAGLADHAGTPACDGPPPSCTREKSPMELLGMIGSFEVLPRWRSNSTSTTTPVAVAGPEALVGPRKGSRACCSPLSRRGVRGPSHLDVVTPHGAGETQLPSRTTAARS